MRQDVEFTTRDGTVLRGWFFTPSAVKWPYACIVMTHGFTGQIEHGLEPFAEDLVAAGYAVLLYDHRCWGRSEGAPRLETNPFLQMQDTRDAITWLSLRDDVDAGRIGLWGTSYSGGTALIVSAVDRRVRCVASAVPLVSGSQMVRRAVGELNFADHLARLDRAREAEACGEGTQYQQHSSNAETLAFFAKIDVGNTWPNKITVASHAMLLEFEPIDFVHRISPTPLLMIVATDDTRVCTDLQLEAFAQAREPKTLKLVNSNHYEPYIEYFDETARWIREFFQANLPVY